MNVLVSDINKDFKEWVLLRSLKDVDGVVGVIDTLVYHKSKESYEDKIEFLHNIYSKMPYCKIIYVCKEDTTELAIKMYITGGLNGTYIGDEFFLENDESLNSLLSNLSLVVDSTEYSSSAVLQEFCNRYISDGEKSISKGYLQVVKNAAIEMTDAYHNKCLEMIKMSESAADMFNSSVELVSQLREQQLKLEKDLRNLKDSQPDLSKYFVKPSSIMFFPEVSYLKNKKILRVKDLSRCLYLTSFMWGFKEYLEKIKRVRPKLIFVEGTGALLEEMYSSYSWVTASTKGDIGVCRDSMVFTNYPTTKVLSDLLDDVEHDMFIVVDRTVNYKKHILNSKGNVVYAVAGESCINSFSLPRENCFSAGNDIPDTMFKIPFFDDYPSSVNQRLNKYLNNCSAIFELLYGLM